MRNESVPTSDQIRLRIGINVADILIDEKDIAGGGVNLAARLETLAQPGGICISQALKEQIQEDLGIQYVDCGTRRVKNISRPVRVFQVLSGRRPALAVLRMRLQGVIVSSKWPWAVAGVAVLAVGILATMRWSQPAVAEEVEKLSVAVLPFKSTSAESATQELASRLQGQLLMALQPGSNLLKVKGLAGGAQPSASWDVQRVRNELKARYAVVGDVSKVADVQKVNARLLDTATGTVVWGDTFEIPSHLEHVATEIITKRLFSFPIGFVGGGGLRPFCFCSGQLTQAAVTGSRIGFACRENRDLLDLGRQRPDIVDAGYGQQLADLLEADFGVAPGDDGADALALDPLRLALDLVPYAEARESTVDR